ncbi:MAG TPA: hypothetical protein VGR22_03570 [Thermomicrobiales bacterium]|nr:hypothetical protein [Thermomicrobiales bacterium]
MQFVHHAEENGLFTADEAFDHAVLMKVLPKFNGSRGKLQQALFELIHWCRTPAILNSEGRSAYESRLTKFQEDGKSFDAIAISDADTVDENWRYPATGRRASLMMQDLYTDGFASFG